AGVQADLWLLVLLLIANSAIGVYYYLRLIVTMFDRSAVAIAVEGGTGHEITGHWATVLSLGLIASMLLWLGGYPGPVIDFIRLVVTDLTTTVLHADY
ncbi:MAG TPA: hypothetical protein VFU48_10810, partial [Nitrospira sp.]|nr:hypothetical protein [Nitrospira sp.]